VKEIIKTRELEAASYISNEKTDSFKILIWIYGIGKKHDESFFEKGLKVLEDLKKNDHLLTSAQKIGLKYRDNLQIRIPWAEVEEVLII